MHIGHLVATYGYWAVGVSIALESAGIPVPAETILIAAAIAAGTKHNLNVLLIVPVAAIGAIAGAAVGFWIGRRFGYWLLLRYGRYLRINERRIKVGQYLFLRHGGKVVFFGRFVSVLRTLAAMLAGINAMTWPRFLAFNVASGVLWAAVYGFGAFYLGRGVMHLHRSLSIGAGVIIVAVAIGVIVFLRRHEPELERKARLALPGPLEPLGGGKGGSHE